MQRNSEFMERLFTLIMTFGYGAIMAWMYIAAYMGWTRGERSVLMLVAPWIQFMVFLGGVILLILFVILLFNFRRAAHAHHEHGENGEDEANEHTHEHEEGACCDHDHHDHDHNHAHHHHNGECCDHSHDHGWNPARYIPLLIPLILYIMGLPSDQMIRNFERYLTDKALKGQGAYNAKGEEYAPMAAWLVIAMTEPQLAAVGNALQSASDEIDEDASNKAPVVTDLAQIERVMMDPNTMAKYQRYPKVELDGMFSLENQSKSGLTFFRVVRLRMACCLNDSRPASIICGTKKKIDPELLKPTIGSEARWCKAQGKLKFGPGADGKPQAFLKVSSVVAAPMPPFPYLN